MATYNVHYYWNPARRKRQRYSLYERVIDFSKAPVTAGERGIPSKEQTTAWAASDVLEAIGIRAGQTVLGVEFELITPSDTANANVRIGYGSDTDFWGKYVISKSKTNAPAERAFASAAGNHRDQVKNFNNPLYFASGDTIDVIINQAITTGKIRLIAHILEDDR